MNKEQNLNNPKSQQLNMASVMQQRELFVSFARFVQNYKHSYGVAYEEMFSEWLKKRNK